MTCNLWILITCQARMMIQRQFCVNIATVSSLIITKRHDTHISGQWWWFRARWISNLSSRPFPVIYGHMCLLPIIPSYRNDIEQCGWSHCIQLVNRWLIGYLCISTFFGYHLTLRSRDMRSQDLRSLEVEIWHWQFVVNKCMFWCVLKRETRWRSSHFPNILSSATLLAKTTRLFEVVDLASEENSWFKV